MRHSKEFATVKSGLLGRTMLGVAAALIGLAGVASSANAVPKKVKRECRDDYKTFCPAYKVGTSRMRSCMRSNGRQLSWGCYQALKDAGYVRGARRR